jgi:hypothetical protein
MNVANGAQNAQTFSNYFTQKQTAFNSWVNLFNIYDATCTTSNPNGDPTSQLNAAAAKSAYDSIQEPTLAEIYDISGCNSPYDIYFNKDQILNAQVDPNFLDYNIYNNVSPNNASIIYSTIGGPSDCNLACYNAANCVAFSVATGGSTNVCTLYSAYTPQFNNTPGNNLYLQQAAITRQSSNMPPGEIAGIVIGIIIFIVCIVLLGIFIYTRKSNTVG